MKHYMLDTNTVSHLIRKHPNVVQHVASKAVAAICISAITHGELLFGLAKRPEAKELHMIVRKFLQCVDTMPWDRQVAENYGNIRAKMEQQGKTSASLDLLIATHALAVGAILVTNDQAFHHVPGLRLEDWTAAEIAVIPAKAGIQ